MDHSAHELTSIVGLMVPVAIKANDAKIKQQVIKMRPLSVTKWEAPRHSVGAPEGVG